MDSVSFRLATADDADLLFSWVNDSKVRKNSFSSDDISYDEHIQWFSRVLSSEDTEIFLYLVNEEPVGQVRLKYDDETATISYSIAAKFRGQGFGKQMIHDIAEHIRPLHPEVSTLIAKVKGDNIASQKIFESEGFQTEIEDEMGFTYLKTISGEGSVAAEDINRNAAKRERESPTSHKQQKRSETL